MSQFVALLTSVHEVMLYSKFHSMIQSGLIAMVCMTHKGMDYNSKEQIGDGVNLIWKQTKLRYRFCPYFCIRMCKIFLVKLVIIIAFVVCFRSCDPPPSISEGDLWMRPRRRRQKYRSGTNSPATSKRGSQVTTKGIDLLTNDWSQLKIGVDETVP